MMRDFMNTHGDVAAVVSPCLPLLLPVSLLAIVPRDLVLAFLHLPIDDVSDNWK